MIKSWERYIYSGWPGVGLGRK